MKKIILYSASIILCLFFTSNTYSQTPYLTSGEKTGLVLDSLLKTSPVDGVEIRHQNTHENTSESNFGAKSDNFRISGQFIILIGDKKRNIDKQLYYNLEKVLSFIITDKKLILYLEM